MAKTYTASVNVEFWKQHVCVGCGAKFRYRMLRALQGQGTSEEGAQKKLVEAVVKAQQHDVDPHPCPDCGTVQPEMVASVRRAPLVWGLCLAVLGLVVSGIVGAWWMPTSIWTGTALAVLAAIPFVVALRRNPNANPRANLHVAEAAVSAGILHKHAPGEGGEPDYAAVSTGLGPGAMFGMGLIVLAVLIVPLPEVLRMVQGWPMNDRWRPPVIGPGDESTCTFDSKIRSIKGMWRGPASATVVNAKELGLDQAGFPGRTSDDTWGNTISGKNVSSSTNNMWATIAFPDDARLANREIELNLVVQAVFPEERPGKSFDNTNDEFRQSTRVRTATAGAGSTYHDLWLWGHIGAGLGFVLAWFTLRSANNSVAARGNPTEIVAPPGEEPTDIP